MKKMLDVKIEKGYTITLPQRIVDHLDILEGDELRVLLTEKAVVIMRPEVFGEEFLKKL